MNKLLEDYIGKFVEVYIDDIIIYFKNFDEHLKYLEIILRALNEINLKLSVEKSKFSLKKVKFLRHIISQAGIKSNIKTIQYFPIS